MNKTLIKICGITTAELAEQAAIAGANYIGIVFHPDSPRYVNVKQAKAIATAAKQHGAQPVAIFTHHTAQVMQQICDEAGINIVQLHGTIARKEHALLPSTFKRIYVHPITESGSFLTINDDSISNCDKSRDFLLFDSMTPGQGKMFNWKNFNYGGCFSWFLAGGLTCNNVGKAIELLHPTAVDVSSGVEKKPGEKDINLITKFIFAVKNPALEVR